MRNAGGGYKGIFTKEAVRKGEKLVVFGGRIVHAREEVCDYGIQRKKNISNGGAIRSGRIITS